MYNLEESFAETRDKTLPFIECLKSANVSPIRAGEVRILQVNLGFKCNQLCTHCHVNAGPNRKEMMDLKAVERLIHMVKTYAIPTVDLTGGAPELNPHFRYLVKSLRSMGVHVINRCNLTIFFEPGLDDLPRFLKDNGVEVVASLPCYQEKNVDAMRGKGTFKKSIKGLKLLNSLGYGRDDSDLTLKLVYNPSGAFLPPSQKSLEQDFKQELSHTYGIKFNKLLTLANLPISRFGDQLIRSHNFDRYMTLLADNFNPATIEGLMCRHQISMGWDGRLYDCDFNQMLGLQLKNDCPQTIWEFDPEQLRGREIVVGDHCYGCTAGQGSSCGGSLT